uniref:Uncharacterized protein n=1 Tax=Anopheles atroparvus TaxID=41427 RepID=A0AAG5DEN5_ANOAO
MPTVKTEATLGEDFKRFHTLRNSYGGKSNLNVNNTDQTIKSQVLLHQQKLREYSRQHQQHDNDSYSTCSSSQSDYQHPQHQHQPHRHKHHTHYRVHHHQHHQQQQHAQHGGQQQQLQQQQPQPQTIYPISATVAATATLTRTGGVGGGSILKNATNTSGDGSTAVTGTRNGLRRGPGGLSTLSLCSCDAETEIIPNPLRPLYQYSLDRKNPRQHTYTCEQNAQILLRLEKDRQKKFGSMGKLHLA